MKQLFNTYDKPLKLVRATGQVRKNRSFQEQTKRCAGLLLTTCQVIQPTTWAATTWNTMPITTNLMLTKKYTEHTVSGRSTLLTKKYTYSYDNTLWLTSVSHKLNEGTAVSVAEYTYDEARRMNQKKIGNALETTAYAYNLRNWLTSMTGNRFSENLYYTTNLQSGRVVSFSGNIAALTWKSSPNTSTIRGYSFQYDALGRLKNAAYRESATLNSSTQQYDESFTYDKQGNPQTIRRYGLKDDNSFGLIDDLHMMQYIGNFLRKTEDRASDQSGSDIMEFKDGYTASGEKYVVTSMGELMADYNEQICIIKYNCFNLQKSVQFCNGKRIKYLYDTSGIRRQANNYYLSDTTMVELPQFMSKAKQIKKFVFSLCCLKKSQIKK